MVSENGVDSLRPIVSVLDEDYVDRYKAEVEQQQVNEQIERLVLERPMVFTNSHKLLRVRGHLLNIRRRCAGRTEQIARNGQQHEQRQAETDKQRDACPFQQAWRGLCHSGCGGAIRTAGQRAFCNIRRRSGNTPSVTSSFFVYDVFLLPAGSLCFSVAARCGLAYESCPRSAAAQPYPACGHWVAHRFALW